MKKLMSLLLVAAASLVMYACGGGADKPADGEAPKQAERSPSDYDPKRGEGKWTAENIGLTAEIDAAKADAGNKIQGVKCASCHKLTDERLVGPGWAGVTERRTPEWIMNFISNPDPMIEKDPEVQAQLELCLVRMPNQALTDDDSRNILEFMRQNDKK